MAYLFIPQSFRSERMAHPLALAPGATMADAMATLAQCHGDTIGKFWGDGMLHPGFFLVHNQRVLTPGDLRELRLQAGDQVRIVQPLSGG